MNKLVGVLFTLLTLLSFDAAAQNKDTADVSITNYFLKLGATYSWRGRNGWTGDSTQFYDRTSWNSSPYTQGQLWRRAGNNEYFVMNFRLLYPLGYDANYVPGYPMIMMMHGFGERANCWDANCYYGNKSYDPNSIPTGATQSQVNNLLNNDHNLTHGGLPHLDARNLAGTKKPNDPTLSPRAFPGFVLFPQNEDGWTQDSHDKEAIKVLRLLLKQLNVDQNRIYVHGLSDGGAGTYKSLANADWLFAAAAPMSAVNPGTNFNLAAMDSVLVIPIWTFQGGKDTNPRQAQTEGLVANFRAKGGNIRYTLYPSLGHGVWNTAYAEPDFFTWLLTKNKANMHVYYGVPQICSTNGQGVKLGVGQGFFAYQWERDGEVIPGATTDTYTAMLPGVYRVRFSRVSSNPTSESQWNRWSDPVTVTEGAPSKPAIVPLTTTHTPGVTGMSNSIPLRSKTSADFYYWYKNGVIINVGSDTVRQVNTSNNTKFGNGSYTLITANSANCPSVPSDPVKLWMANSTPNTLVTPTGFTGYAISGSSIALSWNDNVLNETGYEVWRRKTGGGSTWVMAIKTEEDAVSFVDTGLEANTSYDYKLRAVNVDGRSEHTPSSLGGTNLVISTLGDTNSPTAPQNLAVVTNDTSSIQIRWNKSVDVGGGVKGYIVYVNGSPIATNSTDTTYTIQGLTVNHEYVITVKAQDFALNVSPNSNQIIGTTYFVGLNYYHTTGAWNSLTNIEWDFIEYSGKVSNFSLSPRVQEDFFNFRFEGYILLPQTRIYQFRTSSDDGSMVFIDGFNPVLTSPGDANNPPVYDLSQFRVVNNDGLHGQGYVSGSQITLSAGIHKIVVLQFENTGGEFLDVQYRMRNASNTAWEVNYTTIPNSMLKTGTYVPPTAPSAPTNLAAVANGMTQINLTWQYGGAGTPEYEIYRSTASNGTYSIINRVSGLSYSDTQASPGTTYYYKLKTVLGNAVSAFSGIANATTVSDGVVPTVPTGLTLLSKTYTNVAFRWTASTDNVGVTGYEVSIDGVIADTVDVATFMASDLAPNTTFSFTVKAMDASGNKSAASAALQVTTNTPVTYYSLANGALNATNTWTLNPDGSGGSPASFANNGQYYVISNRTTSSLGGSWTVGGGVSRVIVPNGVTLTVDNAFAGNLELQGSSTLDVSYNVSPNFVTVSPTSTVIFNSYHTVPVGDYGNIQLNGAVNQNFLEGETIVRGNLTVANGGSLKGAPGNASTLSIYGNLTYSGTTGVVAGDNSITLNFLKNGTQTFNAQGDVDLYSITTGSTTTVNVTSSSSADVRLGSPNGGGLVLANGSNFNLGANSLSLRFVSSINPGNQTGRIGINGGDLSIASSTTSNSNLYFSTTQKSLGLLSVDLTSTGDAIVRSQVDVTEGIKMTHGELNSGGFIRLISNATATAHIQQIENNGVITGDVSVQRYLSPKGKIYRYISTSVEGVTVADWQAYISITGPFTGSSGGSASSMFYYDEPTGGWRPYPASGGNNTAPIQKGVGYSTWLYNGTNPITVEVAGNPYQGDHSFSLDPGTGGGANDGWNLLGNPYASPISWNTAGWNRSGLSNTVSVRDNPSGQFVYWDAVSGVGSLPGGRIAAGQAFWVQALNSSPSLTIHENAKADTQTALYREGNQPSANFFTAVLSNATFEDPAYVILSPDGTDAYDKLVDAVKRPNTLFNLSTLAADETPLAINKTSDSFCTKEIKLSIQNVTAGTYTLLFEDLNQLRGIQSMIFRDNYNNASFDIKTTSSYEFQVTSDAATFGSNRFTVTLTRENIDTTPQLSATDLCGGSLLTATLDHAQGGVQYYVINDDGEVISDTFEGEGTALDLLVPTSSLTAGQNNLRVVANFKGCSSLILPTSTSVNYSVKPAMLTAEPFLNVCQGYAAELTAEGAPASGKYVWYNGNKQVIGETATGLFATDIIREETTYFVAGATANGCTGELTQIIVSPETLEIPLLTFERDTLFVATIGAVQWLLDGEPIEGATNTWLKPTTPGVYTSLVTLGNCSAESDPYEYLVTGVDNPDDMVLNLTIYPNPATTDNINVQVTSRTSGDANIELIDMVGKRMFGGSYDLNRLNDGVRITPTETLPNGIYFVIVNQGGKLVKKKLMIQN